MIQDWWLAHRFELAVQGVFMVLVCVGIGIYWLKSRDRGGRS